jgi:putative thioredoxin
MNTPKSNPNPFAASNPYAATGAYGSSGGGGYGVQTVAPVQAQTQALAEDPAPADLVYDVTEAEVNQRVIERSMQVPVLLDCWAPWCGPCKSLGPLLEKLALDYGGAFELAKINTDQAPQLSAALRIRSIPLVVLFMGGRPVDQFTGALPEGQIRAFLDKHLPPLGDPMDALRAEAAAAQPEEAEALLEEALHMVPGHADASADLAERWLARDRPLADVTTLLDKVPAEARGDRDAGLRKRIQILANRPAGDPQALTQRIAANPRDFEARFALAAHQVFASDYNAAFDNLLEVVMRDKADGKPDRERARVQLIDWFAACPDAEAVSRGRRYLGMYLN